MWFESNELLLNEDTTAIYNYSLGNPIKEKTVKLLDIQLTSWNRIMWKNIEPIFAMRPMSTISNKETAMTINNGLWNINIALWNLIISYGIIVWDKGYLLYK